MPRRKNDEDSEYEINHYQRKRNNNIVKKQMKKPLPLLDKNQGKWNLAQKRLYIQFVQQNIKEISDQNYRKEIKIFKQMSIFLKTRTPDQCRSHHQKIIKFHNSIDSIIKIYQERGIISTQNITFDQNMYNRTFQLQKDDKPTTEILEHQSYFHQLIKKERLLICIDDCQMEEF